MKKSVALLKGFVCAFLLTGLFVTDSALVSAAETESAHEQELKVEYPTGGLSEAWKDSKVEPFKVSKEEFKKLPGTRLNRVSLNSYRTDDYYYDMLNEDDKLVYDAFLKASRMNLEPVASGEEVNLETQAVVVYKGNRELNINWKSVYPAIEFDHPEELESLLFTARVPYTWVDNGDGTTTYVYYLYFGKASDYTGAQIEQMESELKSACNSFYNGLSLSGSDFDKELAIHDALIEAVEYNHPVADNNRSHDVAHTAYGALVNKSPVCDGYSKAFKMLLNKAGIECHVVAGLGGGGGHAWNIVKIGGDYYEVDATWDDKTSTDDSAYKVLLLHDYFNRTTDDFKNHEFKVIGWVEQTTHHFRNEDYLGYMKPAEAYGTEFSFNNAKKVYALTFDEVIDGAYYYLPYGETCTYEGKIIEMPESERANGYTFDGWYTAKTGGTKLTEDAVFDKDTTLYAHWTAKKITVTLRPQNGQTDTTKEVSFGDTYGELPNNLSRTGYTFAGWYTDATYKTRITEETKVDLTYNHSIYAKWVAGEFTITFDANGGTVKTESITKTAGDAILSLETPERYGYTFYSWYDAKEGGNSVYTIYPVVEDITLYAHWKPVRSRVVFNYNNGSSRYGATYVNYGETYESALNTVKSVSRTGYNLIGWFTEPEGGIQITDDTVIDQVEERNLYAHWEEVTVRVYFHADGSDRELQWVDVKYGQTYGDAIDGLTYEPVKAHATFDGWSTSSTSFYKVNRSSTISSTEEKHFYAHFVDETFTYRLNANGGSFSNGDVSKSYTASYGTEVSLSQYAAPSRTGYTFKGWGISAGSTSAVTSVTISSDVTLYAIWEKISYTLNFSANGGKFADGSQTKSNAVYYGDNVSLGQYDIPSKEGYTFKGWGTSSVATSIIDTLNVTQNKTLYAIWQKNTYTVTISAYGGKFSDGNQTKETSAEYNGYVSLSQYEKPVRNGYTFKGWSTSSTGESKVYSVTVTGNMMVYAIWEMNSYTLRLSGNGGKFADGSQTKSNAVTYGNTVSLDQYETPSKDGYTFKGWSTSSGSTSVVTFVTVSRDVTVYAVWEKIPESSGDNNQGGNSGSQPSQGNTGSQTSQGDNNQSGNTGNQTSQNDNTQTGNTQGDTGNQQSQGDNGQSGNTQSGTGNQPTQGDNSQTGNTQGDNTQGNTDNQPAQGGNNQTGNTQGDNTQGNAGNQPAQGDNNQGGNDNQPAQNENTQSENTQPATVAPVQPANEETAVNVPVDATITDGGNDLQLSSTGNASVIDNGNMDVSSVNIGDSVTYGGISYNITEIKDNAYKNRKKLKSFSVGANIEKIGSNAFSGCKSLKKITIKANNLKTVGKGSFKGIKNGAKITVICKDKKTFNKVTKMLKKAGAKKAKFKFKKG